MLTSPAGPFPGALIRSASSTVAWRILTIVGVVIVRLVARPEAGTSRSPQEQIGERPSTLQRTCNLVVGSCALHVVDHTMMNAPEHVESVRVLLEQYLRSNPGACDTIDGMVGWWLGGMWLPGYDRPGMWRLVECAVEQLVADGRLRRLPVHATKPHYMDSIAEFVPLELLFAKDA